MMIRYKAKGMPPRSRCNIAETGRVMRVKHGGLPSDPEVPGPKTLVIPGSSARQMVWCGVRTRSENRGANPRSGGLTPHAAHCRRVRDPNGIDVVTSAGWMPRSPTNASAVRRRKRGACSLSRHPAWAAEGPLPSPALNGVRSRSRGASSGRAARRPFAASSPRTPWS